MGLCKCPQKKVTNLFCFEHRVNVCENCLVENHTSCIVQSYLQWLTDCDFDTNCSICEKPLTEGETIRLQCLHVLHWACLDKWARQLPPTTAPAGYKCPFCREALFPASNQISPIIEKLRLHLQRSNWGRIGLGLPILPESEDITPLVPALANSATLIPSTPIAGSGILTGGQYSTEPNHLQHKNRAKTPETVLEIDDANYSGPSQEVTFTSRKKHFGNIDADTRPLLSNEKDTDSELNKYKRRPAGEWLSGIWKAKYGNVTTTDQFSGYKRTLFIIFLCAILLVTFISVMTRVSSAQEGDPMLDPMANPNIRIAADDSIPSVK